VILGVFRITIFDVQQLVRMWHMASIKWPKHVGVIEQ